MQLKTALKLHQRSQNDIISDNISSANDKNDEASNEESIPRSLYTHNKIYLFTPKCSSLTAEEFL